MPDIRTLFIFEILGKPAEHIKDSLNKIVDELGEKEGINIVRREVHEPKRVDREGKESDLFTTFAEVELETEDMKIILAIVMNMLPAHVEILAPVEYRFKNFELSSFLTEVTIKVHKYDELAKLSLFERNKHIEIIKELEEKVKNLEAGIKGEVKTENRIDDAKE